MYFIKYKIKYTKNEDKYKIFRYEIKDMTKPWPGITNPVIVCCIFSITSSACDVYYACAKVVPKEFLKFRYSALFILKVTSITIDDNFNYFIFNTYSFGLILECYFRLEVLEMNLFECILISASIKKFFLTIYLVLTHFKVPKKSCKL